MISFFLQLYSETFLILRRIQRHINIDVLRSSCKVPFMLVRNWNFLDRSSINAQIQNFIKIRPVGAEMFHADGRTDVISNFRRALSVVFFPLGESPAS